VRNLDKKTERINSNTQYNHHVQKNIKFTLTSSKHEGDAFESWNRFRLNFSPIIADRDIMCDTFKVCLKYLLHIPQFKLNRLALGKSIQIKIEIAIMRLKLI